MLQFFMDAFEFSAESPLNILVFGIECLFVSLFDLPEGFGISFIGFDIGEKMIKFFLFAVICTSTDANLFFKDM